jgi:magnesium and cobalt exporter, CNNM family
MTTLLWVVGIALTVSFVCSILEATLLSVTHGFVEVLKERGSPAGPLLDKLRQQIDQPIAAILTLNTIANTMGAAIAGSIAEDVFGQAWITAFSAVLTLLVLFYSEIIPKTLGATYWERLAVPAAYILRVLIILLKPVLIPLTFFSSMIRGNRLATISREELAALASVGRREGSLDEDEWEVVTNVIHLDQVQVSEVMTPRTDMIAVPIDASIQEAMDTMLDEGHLRLPVFRDNLDQIEGIVVARDLWRANREGKTDLGETLRSAPYVPTTKPVEDLLPEMRADRLKMAIIVDEFGGTAGLVTLEDLIEEIVGEIQDEHEGDEPTDFHELSDGQIRIWGGVPVREVNADLDLSLDPEIHDTIGGFVFGSLGRVGRVGDVVEIEGGHFRITHMQGRRVEYVVLLRDGD